MSVMHHPPESLVTAYAAGTLDLGQHVAVATHLVACQACRARVRSVEETGGAVLTDLRPTPLSALAFSQVEARLSAPAPARSAAPALRPHSSEIPELPGFVRRYGFGEWKLVAPSLEVRRITLPHQSATRVFLLKARAGTRLLEHTHSGVELTCVLTGAFEHDGGRFAPGDFDFGDGTVEHQPRIEPDRDCICLVAMQGSLRLNGMLGRLMQPFVRL